MPACPKCGNRMFSTSQIQPVGTSYLVTVVHCANIACQAIVSTIDFNSNATMLKKIESKLDKVERHVSEIERKVVHVSRQVAAV